MHFLDKRGWPIERVTGRWVLNFLRLIIHTRKVRRGKYPMPTPDPSVGCQQEQGHD